MRGFSTDKNCLFYEFLRRPIFAVSAEPKWLRQLAIRRLQPSTIKRAAYRGILTILMMFGLDWIFYRPIKSDLGAAIGGLFDWDAWLEQVGKSCDVSKLEAAIFWPTEVKRGRVYVHFFDQRGRPVAFAKLSVSSDTVNDSRFLREADTLKEMETKDLNFFQVPKVITHGFIGGKSYLLMSPLPVTARPIAQKTDVNLDQCIKEFAKPLRYISTDMLPRLSWWPHYLSQLDDRGRVFHEEMMQGLYGRTIAVCRAHGDLSLHNIVQHGKTLWIFDWEESVPDVPVLTDSIGFAVSLKQSMIRKNPVFGTRIFKKAYLENIDNNRRLDIMLALAFRQAANIDDAALIIQNWIDENEKTRE